jgi:hypothetical protein
MAGEWYLWVAAIIGLILGLMLVSADKEAQKSWRYIPYDDEDDFMDDMTDWILVEDLEEELEDEEYYED